MGAGLTEQQRDQLVNRQHESDSQCQIGDCGKSQKGHGILHRSDEHVAARDNQRDQNGIEIASVHGNAPPTFAENIRRRRLFHSQSPVWHISREPEVRYRPEMRIGYAVREN